MSISVSLKNNTFSLDKLDLPTRFYHFNDVENYIKFLNIGEVIFPKDKIRTNITLEKSNSINKKILIGVVSHKNMFVLKKSLNNIWNLYRECLNKKQFNLGKQ